MTDQDFIKLLSKTSRKSFIIGLFILAFGAFMIWLDLSGVDKKGISGSGKIVLYVFAGLFIAVGLLMVVRHLKNTSKIKNGEHALINAVNGTNDHYVLWFYENIIQVRGGGTAHQIFIFGKDKKNYNVNVAKAKVPEMLQYLNFKFPGALKGYSKELQAEYNNLVGKS